MAITDRKNTALHVSVQFGGKTCAEDIYSKCEELLRRANSSGDTALHIAARTGSFDIVKFIIDCDSKDLESRNERLTRMVNEKKDTALHEAVRNNHFEIVNLLIEADTEFQYLPNDAGETPVYLSAETGSCHIVQKMIKYTLTSAACGGPDGRNALHAAILLDKTDIAKLLMNVRELVKEKDNVGWTPLHCAASRGAIEIIKEITQHCLDSWELVDNKGRNFLHVDIVHQQDMVVNYILKSDNAFTEFLNEPDNEGNNPLHLAVYSSNTRIIKILIKDDRVNKNAMNNNNLRVRDIAFELIKLDFIVHNIRIAGGISSQSRWISQRQEGPKAKKRRNIEEKEDKIRLVIATLILTVTFTAGMTVPGGFKSDGPEAGSAILTRITAFDVFVISNSIAMTFSSFVVFSYLWGATKSSINQNFIFMKGTIFSSFALIPISPVVAFLTGSYAVLSNSRGLAIASMVVCSYFLLDLIFSRFLLKHVVMWFGTKRCK